MVEEPEHQSAPDGPRSRHRIPSAPEAECAIIDVSRDAEEAGGEWLPLVLRAGLEVSPLDLGDGFEGEAGDGHCCSEEEDWGNGSEVAGRGGEDAQVCEEGGGGGGEERGEGGDGPEYRVEGVEEDAEEADC